jgi:hypothetical protein
MKLSTLLPMVMILVLVISLVCVWFFPSVQDFMAANVMWNGISQFNREFQATIIDSLKPGEITSRGTLVAVPYLEYSESELMEIRRFVTGGGTLLLMDDFGYGNSVLAFLGIEARFSHKPLLDPLFCHKNPALPIITDFNPKVDGINEVLMNHATTLVNVADEEVVARSSAFSFLDVNENSSYDEGEPKGPFAVSAVYELDGGTAILVADPSTVINSVVNRFDNYAFITSLIGGQSEQRIVIDRSHLAKAPLDISKTKLTDARQWLSNPYVLVILTAMIFVLSGITVRKGGILEHQGSR